MIYFPKLGKMGRLGNQLFQVAAGLAHAERARTELILPSAWLKYGKYFRGPWNVSDFLPECGIIKEEHFYYHQLPTTNYLLPTEIEGYFQSEKHFQDQRAAIRKALSWASNNGEGAFFPTTELQEKLKVITEPGRHHIAIHVRRGDYLTYPTHFPPLSGEYHSQAFSVMLQELLRLYGNDLLYWKVHVFSDDILWCKETMRDPGERSPADDISIPAVIIDDSKEAAVQLVFHEGNTDIEDLYLMTHCQHFIIANSSFSWWGAWLAANPSKIVLAPDHTKWFGPENGFYGQTQDLIPNNWIQVKF